jgi:hypothetical protein
MKFSIVFDSSGDFITFQTISNQTADVLSYYVDNLNNKNLNKFASDTLVNEVLAATNKLHSAITESNKFIYELLDRSIATCELEDYLDQQLLNKLHADYVFSHTVKYDIHKKRKQYNYSEQSELIHSMFSDDTPDPTVAVIINKLGYVAQYGDINTSIHLLEKIFSICKFRIASGEWFKLPNPFSKEILTNDICNFSIAFNHLGRTLYNKFKNHDYNLDFDDENSYDNLHGFVNVKLSPAQTIPLSKEYTEWCKSQNKVPSGDFLNIGNILDLAEKVSDYRKIIFRNSLQKNNFSIQLNKGN